MTNTEPAPKRPPVMRRTLLVDREMQAPLLIYSVVSGVTGIFLGVYFTIFDAAFRNFGFPLWLTISIYGLVMFICLMILIIVGLLITNKLAGPLVRLRVQMKNFADGNDIAPLSVRKGDYTLSLYQEYNRMVERINKKSNPKN